LILRGVDLIAYVSSVRTRFEGVATFTDWSRISCVSPTPVEFLNLEIRIE